MTGFFDDPRPSGTNRAAPPSDCPTCGGDRLVLVDHDPGCDLIHPSEGQISARSCDCGLGDAEVYQRCPQCNPAPASERQPVQGARWQDYDR